MLDMLFIQGGEIIKKKDDNEHEVNRI